MRRRLRDLAVLLSCSCSGWAGADAVPGLPMLPLPWVGRAADAALAGSVRDAEGRAPAGAQVCAWEVADTSTSQVRARPVCTLAGPDGAFVLEGLAPSSYEVHASAPNRQPADFGRPIVLRPQERRARIDVTLAPGGTPFEGVVVDIDGEPVAGATVTNFQRYNLGAAAAVARSDAQGRFTLWVSPGIHTLSVDAAGFVDDPKQVDTLQPQLRLVVAPESTIEGTVVDAHTGAPVAGVRVAAQMHGNFLDRGVAYTDEAGAFRIGGLSPGTYQLRGETGNRRGQGDRAVALGLGERFTLPTIALRSLPGVSGRVTVTGAPEGACAGGLVSIDEGDRHAAIDADGEFMFPAVEPGEWRLQALCPGQRRLAEPLSITVGRAPLTGVQIALTAGRTIAGTVVDNEGRPVAATSVGAVTASGDLERPEGMSGSDPITDGAGRFEIRGLAPGVFKVQELGATEPIVVEVPEGRDVGGVKLVAGTVGEIGGIVVDAGGRPVQGASVVIHGDGIERSVTVEMPSFVPTRESGRFVIRGVLPGEHTISAQSPAPVVTVPELRAPGRPVTVLAGPTAEQRLAVAGAPAPIRGQVTRGGAPVARAVVTARVIEPIEHGSLSWARMQDWRWYTQDFVTTTDAAGRFEFAETFAGNTYLLRAHPLGGGYGIVDAVAGSEVALVVPHKASLAGKITGATPTGFAVQLVGEPDAGTSMYFRHTSGRWGFSELEPGTYRLAVASRLGCAKLEVTLRAGERREDVAVTFARLGGVRGRVLDTRGTPVGGIAVTATPVDPELDAVVAMNDVPSASTEADGSFEIVGVCPGMTSVRVSTGLREGYSLVAVDPGRMMNVGVTVEAAGREP